MHVYKKKQKKQTNKQTKKRESHFKFDLLISLEVQRNLCKYGYFISLFSLLKEITMEAFILLS